MNKRVEQAINDQIQAELYSAYLYLAMAAYAEDQNLSGFANWMSKQAGEEQAHALKLYHHVIERGGRVVLQGIDAPPADYGTALEMFQEVYIHEQKVTSLIHALYEVALEEKDYAAQSMLTWFIDEQVEEEASASEIVAQLEMVGNKPQGLLMLDRALASR